MSNGAVPYTYPKGAATIYCDRNLPHWQARL